MPSIRLVKNSQAGTQDKGSVKLSVKDIPLGDIVIRENVRKDYAGIEELAESIRQHGLLQPITVYADGDQYVVKTGHRRFLASQLLYKKEPDRFHSVRCIISNAENLAVIQLVENVQREDLSQIDLYNGLSALKEQGMALKEIAQTMGKSESYIKFLFMGVKEINNTPELKDALQIAGNTLQDIVETKGITDPKERLEVIEQHKKGKITREEMRVKVRQSKQPATPSKKGKPTAPDYNVKYWVSADGLTIKLTFPDTKLVKKMDPKIRKVFKENKVSIL
jgi:ParB family chromosome partitioning protein